jgi:stage II sporulation protein GA (sporulation sigma-E factor processing peptidase)
MKPVIYIDVLLCVNLFVNYFLLLATARFLKLPSPRKRILLGAVVGAIYSLSILLPSIPEVLSLLVKLLMSVTIVLTAFGKSDLKCFLKQTACFYVVNFGFAGLMFAIWHLFAPRGLILNNGIVYFNISPILLVVFTVICYLLLRILQRFSGQETPEDIYCMVGVTVGGNTVSLRAKIDTGNSLVEPFSQLPVIVADFKEILPVLPKEIEAMFRQTVAVAEGGTVTVVEENPISCRMVPFQALSGEGVLPAFRPDTLVISQNNRAYKKEGYVAVCKEGTLSGDFYALVNPQLLS